MRRGIWITLLAVVAFVVIVVARLPASWVVPAPPAAVSCAAVDGSIWNGACAGFTAEGAPLGDLTWSVYPLSLFTGKLAANVELTGPVVMHGDFAVALDKTITARNVQASVTLDQGIKRLVPALQALSGSANANIVFARYTNGFVRQIQGHIEAHDLVSHDRDGVATLGSYAVTFPASNNGSGDPTGQLQDLGGPLVIQGTLRVMQDKPGVEVHGLVKPRAEATPDLRHQLEYLGSPDAQGRREFGPIPYYF